MDRSEGQITGEERKIYLHRYRNGQRETGERYKLVYIFDYGTPAKDAAERWPENVLPNGKAFGDDWSHDGEKEYTNIDNLCHITAWMPIPEAYEEE